MGSDSGIFASKCQTGTTTESTGEVEKPSYSLA